ncbi:HAD family hydrolase [Gilvimarinus xylanilyticus]|uniref:Histidinol-phosphatase n=1 Tax=Gilvimarinus xylanilyticus TaxID=2944139 RepID=A0A9X2I128_9GAMM|nr:HAD family hydrolase [Gilvimarinus xylanilyticus]MCP8900699.1 HAD-IB family hydrolase [Gilvimarinus xylanilyticus]
MALAIFDLDNTLIGDDSDYLWGEYLVAEGLVDESEYRQRNEEFYQDYKAARLDIDAYLRFAMSPLPERTPAQWKGIHDKFLTQAIHPVLLPKALDLIEKHRTRGDYLLIITATNGFITRPIAELLQVDEILATDPELVDGHYTGRYLGTPCFGEGKVTNLEQWLQGSPHSLQESYFYSDSINDLPLLERVSHPVAVNPDPRLQALAEERDWPVMDLRDA